MQNIAGLTWADVEAAGAAEVTTLSHASCIVLVLAGLARRLCALARNSDERQGSHGSGPIGVGGEGDVQRLSAALWALMCAVRREWPTRWRDCKSPRGNASATVDCPPLAIVGTTTYYAACGSTRSFGTAADVGAPTEGRGRPCTFMGVGEVQVTETDCGTARSSRLLGLTLSQKHPQRAPR